MITKMKGVIVILSNEKHAERAMSTIRMLRDAGQWSGDVVWLAVDYEPSIGFINEYRLEVLRRKMIDMTWLWDLRQKYPFADTDGREKHKLIQFSKWWVFDPFFKKWDSLLYLDAGMHISRPVQTIFSIPHKRLFVAPDDRFPFNDPAKNFRCQFSSVMSAEYRNLEEYCANISSDLLDRGGYFLNCIWLMDTVLITDDTIHDLIHLAHRFPISKTNEMAIMNLYFYNKWQPLPESIDGQYIFDWTERFGRGTKDYICLKYPHFPKD